MFNFNHLYYFYITAKMGGVSTAARFLRISQPSLSAQLKTFENSLDKNLFQKEGRRLQLTADGELVYTYCRKMFEIANDLSQTLKSASEKQNLRIKIGVSGQIERTFVADLLTPIIQKNTTKQERIFGVTSGTDEELKKALLLGDIDILITNKLIYADNIEEIFSFAMPVKLLIAKKVFKKLRSEGHKELSLKNLLNNTSCGLVIPTSNTKLRHETDAYLQEIKISKKVVFESDMISVVGRAIVDGAGCGFMPIPYLMEEIKLGLIEEMGPQKGLWKHNLYLVTRKEPSHNEAIEEVKAALKAFEKWA